MGMKGCEALEKELASKSSEREKSTSSRAEEGAPDCPRNKLPTCLRCRARRGFFFCRSRKCRSATSSLETTASSLQWWNRVFCAGAKATPTERRAPGASSKSRASTRKSRDFASSSTRKVYVSEQLNTSRLLVALSESPKTKKRLSAEKDTNWSFSFCSSKKLSWTRDCSASAFAEQCPRRKPRKTFIFRKTLCGPVRAFRTVFFENVEKSFLGNFAGAVSFAGAARRRRACMVRTFGSEGPSRRSNFLKVTSSAAPGDCVSDGHHSGSRKPVFEAECSAKARELFCSCSFSLSTFAATKRSIGTGRFR